MKADYQYQIQNHIDNTGYEQVIHRASAVTEASQCCSTKIVYGHKGNTEKIDSDIEQRLIHDTFRRSG